MQELRHALRLHARRPMVTAAAVLTLALGIGANTAIFSIVHGVLQPLDYPAPGELIRVFHTMEFLKSSSNARMRAIWNRIPVSYLNAEAWRAESEKLTGLGLYTEWQATLGGAEPRGLEATRTDAELFAVLGVEPALGHLYSRTEVEHHDPVVVLAHGFWQERYGGDPEVLGKALRLDDEVYTVIGVMPAGFGIAGRGEERLWAPIFFTDDDLQNQGNTSYAAMARLAPGVSLAAAETEIAAVTARLVEAHPEELGQMGGMGIHFTPLLDFVVGDSRAMLLLLMATVVLVLLIACSNVAHLLLARAADRRHELAVRAALGAGRGRLLRQFLTESLVLTLVGGAGGLLLAFGGHRVLLELIPADLPRTHEIALDAPVLLFTLGVSLLAAFAAGLLPALFGARISAEDLRVGSGSASAASRSGRGLTHGGFVVAEIALSLVLTAAAGLLVASFLRLSAVDPGFRPDEVLVQDIQLPTWRYDAREKGEAWSRELLAALQTKPGIRNAALTTKLPLPGPSLVTGLRVPGVDSEDEDWTQGKNAHVKFVTPDYFEVLGIPLLEGRVFDATDRDGSRPVMVVNRALAEMAWPGESPMGRRAIVRNDLEYHVIGVIGDVRQDGVDTPGRPLMYFAWEQPWRNMPLRQVIAVAGIGGDPATAISTVQRTVRELDPQLALAPVETLDGLLGRSISAPRSRTTLVALFALLALVLTVVGTYAVMSFTVSRRLREIGVRMALGADSARVRVLVLGRTLRLTVLGIALGTAGAFAGARLLEGLLYDIEPTHLPTYAGAVVVIAATAFLAGYLPAEKASRVDPVRALRSE